MKTIWRFFTSLKLFQVAGLLFIALAAIGSVLVSALPQAFSEIDRDILFRWLKAIGIKHLPSTFWVFGLILILLFIALNTLICSLDKLPTILRQINRPAVKARHPLLRWTILAPYLAHLGFLLVLLGHLISSMSGFRTDDNVYNINELKPIPHLSAYLKLERFTPLFFADGMPRQFHSEVTLYDENMQRLKQEIISVNHPMFYQGAGFYQKSYGETLDKIKLRLTSATKQRQNFSLGERETRRFGEDQVLTFKSFTANFRGMGYGMAYFELTSRESISSGAAYLMRGRNSVRLGEYTLTITDATSKTYTVLTINRDPGAVMVLVGAVLMTLFALITAAVDYRRFLGQS